MLFSFEFVCLCVYVCISPGYLFVIFGVIALKNWYCTGRPHSKKKKKR